MSNRTQYPSKKFAKVKKYYEQSINVRNHYPNLNELFARYPEFSDDPNFPVWFKKIEKKYSLSSSKVPIDSNDDDDDPPLSSMSSTNQSSMQKLDKKAIIDSILEKMKRSQLKSIDHKTGDKDAINFIIKTKLIDLYLMSLNLDQLEQFMKFYPIFAQISSESNK